MNVEATTLPALPVRTAIPCPVCDSRNARSLYEPTIAIDDPARLYGAASGVPGTQRLVRCSDCTVIYENPRFAEDVILRGYMSSEEGAHDSQYPMRVASFRRALEKLAGRLPAKGARVLDIGTAGGAFLDAATAFGYDAHGLEPSAFLVERGKARGLQIDQGTIESHGFAPASFDMVCLWDVIEHLAAPKRALEQIRPLLKPGGVLLINFPDIGTWQAKLAGRRFWWILSVHLTHFTRRTLADLLARTGFRATHFRRYWQVLQFGYLEDVAIHYRIPLARLGKRLTPDFLQRLPIPYYASQTTALARLEP